MTGQIRRPRGGVPWDTLSDDERAAIKRLEKALKGWPDSLLLFGAGGGLQVRKPLPDGGAGYPAETIEIIDCPCDGGDGADP